MSATSDYDCPKCSKKLRVESAEGVDGVDLLVCTKCWGLAVQAKTMHGVVPDEVREKIEDTGVKHPEGHSCPVCPSMMLEIAVPKPFGSEDRASEPEVKIDICGDCATIWFDAGELDTLNGIKPKLREVNIEGNATKIVVQLDSSEKQHLGRKAAGLMLGSIGLLWAFGGGNLCSLVLGLLLAIGGGILALTTAPETGLEGGVCSRCGLNKTIGWTCQRAGCEAPICTTCRSVGDDPVETYVKTLGGGALVVAGGVLGIGLFIVTEGAAGEAGFVPAALGAELLLGDEDEKEDLLVCKECKKEMGALRFATPSATHAEKKGEKGGVPWGVEVPFAEGMDEKKAESKSAQMEDFLKSQTHCLHIGDVKRCRRMVYRKSGYCYMHKRE